jgi:hypothetical protein
LDELPTPFCDRPDIRIGVLDLASLWLLEDRLSRRSGDEVGQSFQRCGDRP